MGVVYLLSKPLALYSGVAKLFPSYFSSLQQSKDISEQTLLSAFPQGSKVTAYFDIESAQTAVRQARKMAMVVDDNPRNIKGMTYRSIKTPIIFEVQLNVDLKENEKSPKINKELLDLNQPIKIINIEKGYSGVMPASIDYQNLKQDTNCSIM